ncbi:3-keto-5-aminohexanoate cleavage protein [Streptomyces sp. NPDC003016]
MNWHEDGAATVATTLLDRDIGIEAGIYSGTQAAQRFLSWPDSHRVLRILAEITDTSPQTAIQAATGLLQELRSATKASILLHGEDNAAWAVLQMAASLQLDMRIGLEDVLQLPDGTTAETNADLIHAARGIIQ